MIASPMMAAALHPRSIWSPHRDSGCVQVCKSLLRLRGEDWLWVDQPQQACWIVIDASRPVGDSLDALLGDKQPRHWIALAKSWSEVPSPHWAFFKLPLTPRSFFPWINKNLGLPTQSHVDKELPSPAEARAPTSAPWEGQWLRLKRWPNLSAYPGLPLQLVKLCRQLLMEEVSHAQLRQDTHDDPILQRLLADAWQQGNLLIAPAPAGQAHPATDTPSASAHAGAPATVRSAPGQQVPLAAAPQTSARREPGLFQRFLNRFR